MFNTINRIFMDTCAEFGISYAENEESATEGDLYLDGDESFVIKEMGQTEGREISTWQFADDMTEALGMARVFRQRQSRNAEAACGLVRKYYIGWISDSDNLIEFKSAYDADYNAEEWVSIEACSWGEAKALYNQKFAEWQTSEGLGST